MKSKKKMKRKRMKKGMLLAELYRLFTVRRLMTGIFLVALIAVISVSDLISIDSISWPAELKQSICDQLQMTLIFDRYKSLYVIAASICTVTTFPSDIKNHVLPYIRQRTDFDSMMNARLFAIAAYIIVTMIGGFIVASFFVLLDPVVRWIVLRSYWMYYVSPVSWSSIEHWKILGTERPLNQNIIIPANVIICIVLFIIAGMGTRRKDIKAQSLRHRAFCQNTRHSKT